MKKSEILRDAKYFLSVDGEERETDFICIAISLVCEDQLGEYSHPLAIELRKAVRAKIGGCFTYSRFLLKQLGLIMEEELPYSSEEIQAMRHQLLDEMITEYEERGE